MFERFTDDARRSVVLAQQEAQSRGHTYIGTEHLLLGLVRDEKIAACQVLSALGVTPGAVRERIDERVARGEGTTSGHIPFTPGAKRALEFSLREALQLDHDYIGSGHILLGVLREEEGPGAEVLAELGVDTDEVRQQIGPQDEPRSGRWTRVSGGGPLGEFSDRLTAIEARLAAIEAQLGRQDPS